MQLNEHAAGQAPGGQHEVLVLAAHPVLGLGGDALDGRAAEPADEVEVVGGEVLDDADVADAVGERADALGGDQEDLAELAVGDAAAQLEQRGVEALDVPDGGAARRPPRRRRSARRASAAVAASGFSTSTATPCGHELARPR